MGSDAHNVFAGHLVRLRGVEPKDWETFHSWNVDSEAARGGYWISFPGSKERQRQWAAKLATQDGTDDLFFFVIETLAGEIVGEIVCRVLAHVICQRCSRAAGPYARSRPIVGHPVLVLQTGRKL